LVASVLGVVGGVGSSLLPAAQQTASAAPVAVEGIDVASFQHPGNAPIIWQAVADSGVRFAIIKATEGPGGCTGSTYTNPWYRQDFTDAGAVGLYRGAYHFARPQLPISTAATQAAQFVSVAGTMPGARDLPPVLDLEESCGLNPTDLIAWTRTFLAEVQRLTGRVPIIYTGPWFWRTFMADTTWFSDTGYRLWLASYASTPGALPGGWSAYTMWQFTSSARVPGINANVDRNRLGGDESLLRALGGSAPTQAVTLADGAGSDGRQTVLARRADNSLWEKRQVAPNRDWGPWVKAADGIIGTPELARNADGRLEQYAVSVFGVLIHRWQNAPNGTWSPWAVLATRLSGRPLAITANPDGRLELFATTADGRLGHTWQHWPNGAWAPWEAIGPPAGAPNLPAGPLAASANPDGRLEAFGVQTNGDVGHSWQLWPGGPWSGWSRLDRGADPGSAVAIEVNGDGRLEIFATIAGGQLAHSWQTPGNQTGWSGLIGMGAPVAGAAMAVNVDAAKRIVIRAPGSSTLSGRAIRLFQDPFSAGGWARANSDGASLVGPMVLGRNADGRLELFALSLTGEVVHSWEPVVATGPGTWSAWISL
jgi:GH25 family lysozyme M1 (1,4-beta-N-acetylmuramidase)